MQNSKTLNPDLLSVNSMGKYFMLNVAMDIKEIIGVEILHPVDHVYEIQYGYETICSEDMKLSLHSSDIGWYVLDHLYPYSLTTDRNSYFS